MSSYRELSAPLPSHPPELTRSFESEHELFTLFPHDLPGGLLVFTLQEEVSHGDLRFSNR